MCLTHGHVFLVVGCISQMSLTCRLQMKKGLDFLPDYMLESCSPSYNVNNVVRAQEASGGSLEQLTGLMMTSC